MQFVFFGLLGTFGTPHSLSVFCAHNKPIEIYGAGFNKFKVHTKEINVYKKKNGSLFFLARICVFTI